MSDIKKLPFILPVYLESLFLFSVHSFGSFKIPVHFFGFSKSHLHFYVVCLPTWPKYACASSTPPFLRIYSTIIFLRIPDTSISMYPPDQNILAHPWHLNKHSFAPLTPSFLRINSFKYSCSSWTPPFLLMLIYLTNLFFRIPDTFIATTNLLNHNILAHPQHLHFYVSTQPYYSCPPVDPPFLHTYSTKPQFLRSNTPPNCTHASLTTPFLLNYLTKILLCASSTPQQNLLSHPWHLHFYVSLWPKVGT